MLLKGVIAVKKFIIIVSAVVLTVILWDASYYRLGLYIDFSIWVPGNLANGQPILILTKKPIYAGFGIFRKWAPIPFAFTRFRRMISTMRFINTTKTTQIPCI